MTSVQVLTRGGIAAVALAFISWLALPQAPVASPDVANDSTALEPLPLYGQEIKAMVYILDNKHYKRILFNDSLSSLMLDAYIKALDNNKTYFLRSDIESFAKYRFLLDDRARAADVSPAYEIYSVFQKRYFDRMAFAEEIIFHDFDYTKSEDYQTARDDEPWSANAAEMDELWRKIIKNQALSMKVAGKPEDDIRKELCKRYDWFSRNISQINREDVFNMYANALTETYDPHTSYFSPQLSTLFQESMSLSIEGIGARLKIENDYTKIMEILPGGPAQKSGQLHANDFIVGVGQGVEGEIVDVIGWRLDDVVKLIKGPKGTVVRLQLLPATSGVNAAPEELLLTRDKIAMEDQAAKKKMISYTTPSGKRRMVSVISLPSFYMDFQAYDRGDANYKSTTRDVKRLIEESIREGVEGIVLDLRNNGGGSLAEAIGLTGLFIKDGPVVQTRNDDGKIAVDADQDLAILYSGPLVVLTNRFSASASEILAAAIQDYQRGVVVGEATYGKGTVQTLINLGRFVGGKEKVGQLKLTTQMFYRVNGGSTQHKGVSPDVTLPPAYGEKRYGESAQPSALPWNRIQAVRISQTDNVNERIKARLHKLYQERLLHDAELKQYALDMETIAERLANTTVSLNEGKRRAEMKSDTVTLVHLDTASLAKKRKNSSGDELQQLNDEYLREGILTLDDLIDAKKLR